MTRSEKVALHESASRVRADATVLDTALDQPHIVYTPPDLAKLYAFPGEADGAGQSRPPA